MGRRWAVMLGICAAGCASEINDGSPLLFASGPGADGGLGGLVPTDAAAAIVDAHTTSDAFFIEDPPVPYCGPDASAGDAALPSGPIECPSDKNREGCPCTTPGASAACWPGRRENRNHGICKDGVAKCVQTDEFGARWGECVGYKLPQEGALEGPEACGCFSSGTWAIDNLAPCIFDRKDGSNRYLYSSHLAPDGTLRCNSVSNPPPPRPPENWNTSTLQVDCSGQFQLCYTIKAGKADSPKPTDCTIHRACVDIWYAIAGQVQPMPNLPGWTSNESGCAGQFIEGGGYGEMSVLGESIECDAVDDGMGNPYVFRRTSYCPVRCLDTPNTAECKGCSTGGSGEF